MSVTVRAARAQDAPAATNILRRSIAMLCIPDHQADSARLASWLANKTSTNVQGWIAAVGNYCVVACIDGIVCGFSAMTVEGVITLCYVDPAARFAGVSSAMLAGLEDEGRRLGLTALRLTASKTARRFYLERGYVESADAMEKRLHSK